MQSLEKEYEEIMERTSDKGKGEDVVKERAGKWL